MNADFAKKQFSLKKSHLSIRIFG